MTNDDNFLDTQFAAYRNELMADVTPAGSAAVRATVRHRRKVATVAGAAVAVALIVGPAAGYAAMSRGPAPPAPGTTTEPTPDSSPSPSVSPSPRATTTTAGSASDGKISRAQLLAATVDLPPWADYANCADAGARLSDKGTRDGDNWLVSVKYGDIDQDGSQETIAVIRCVPSLIGQSQVVVFDRDAAGNIVTVDRIVATDKYNGFPLQEHPGWIFGTDPRADGSIRVELGDVVEGGGMAEERGIQRQWRTYKWNGKAFEQIGGPTNFQPPLTDLTVTATNITFGEPDADGRRHGTTTVTVRNAGPVDATHVFLTLELGNNQINREGSGWAGCQEVANTAGPLKMTCLLSELKAGKTRTLTLGLALEPTMPSQARIWARVLRLTANRDPLDDLKQADNVYKFAMF